LVHGPPGRAGSDELLRAPGLRVSGRRQRRRDARRELLTTPLPHSQSAPLQPQNDGSNSPGSPQRTASTPYGASSHGRSYTADVPPPMSSHAVPTPLHAASQASSRSAPC